MPARAIFIPLLAALLAAALPQSARADGGPGTSGAEFLTIGVGARPAGMADAFTGVADDVHALAYNPAGLAFLRRREIGLEHNVYAAGINHEWLGYAHPTAWGTFAGAANLLFISPFESYSSVDNPTGKTSAADMAYQFTFATTVTENWSLGATGKYIRSRLHETTASTYAGDFGTLWKPLPRFSLGGSILNLGPGLRYISTRVDLPRTLRGGASWNVFNPGDFRHTLILALDVEKRHDDSARVGGGLEACYDSVLALRLGGRSLPASGAGLTLGIGLYLFRDETKGYEIDFDYAFVAAGDFATTHRAGLVLKFGEPLTSVPRAAVLQKSDRYYEGTVKPKVRRAPKPAEPEPKRPSPERPSAPRTTDPNDFQWITP